MKETHVHKTIRTRERQNIFEKKFVDHYGLTGKFEFSIVFLTSQKNMYPSTDRSKGKTIRPR